MIKYLYNGEIYYSAFSVRQAIYENERMAFGKEPDEGKEEFWAALGVTYTEEPDPEPTEEELSAMARRRRNLLIVQTDYLLMPDYPISEENLEAIKAYRQALRDVPQQEGFPAEIEWPEMPTVQKL